MRKLMTGIVMIVVMGLASCSSSSISLDNSGENGLRNVSDGSGQGPSGIWYDGIDDLE